MAGHIAVVTDSACDMDDDTVSAHGIRVVPLKIRFGDEEFVDRAELSVSEFRARLDKADELPSTAAPSPGSFAEAFHQAAVSGAEGVVCITLASKLSATYQSALSGATEVRDEIPVSVIDSESCTIGQATLCKEAIRLIGQGADLTAAASAIEGFRQRLRVFATLDTLTYLRKGGRIGSAEAFFGTLLSVKPLVEIAAGEVKPIGRQRTRSRSIEALTQVVAQHAPVEQLNVGHTGATDVERFVEKLSSYSNAGSTAIPVSDIGPVIGTHGGPGVIAVSFVLPVEESSNDG